MTASKNFDIWRETITYFPLHWKRRIWSPFLRSSMKTFYCWGKHHSHSPDCKLKALTFESKTSLTFPHWTRRRPMVIIHAKQYENILLLGKLSLTSPDCKLKALTFEGKLSLTFPYWMRRKYEYMVIIFAKQYENILLLGKLSFTFPWLQAKSFDIWRETITYFPLLNETPRSSFFRSRMETFYYWGNYHLLSP